VAINAALEDAPRNDSVNVFDFILIYLYPLLIISITTSDEKINLLQLVFK